MTWSLHNAAVPGSEQSVQLAVADPVDETEPEVWDAQGLLVLPGFAELHTHIDKTFSPIYNRTGGLWGAIEAYREHGALRSVAEVEAAALQALRKASRHGVTALRSHINMSSQRDLEVLQALVGMRDRLATVIDLQYVAMGALDGTGDDWLRAAVDAGADLIGGAPALEPKPYAAVAHGLELAVELGVGIDLHIDEHNAVHPNTLHELTQLVTQLNFPHSVSASHCAALGCLAPQQRSELITRVAQAGVQVIGLPVCNLVLLGGEHSPRSLATAPLGALRDAGVVTAVGSDNVHDPFNPYGDYAPLRNLQVTNLLEQRLEDELIVDSLALIGSDARRIFYDTVSDGYAAGDWVVLDCREALEAVTRPAEVLATFKAGQLIYRRVVDEQWHGFDEMVS